MALKVQIKRSSTAGNTPKNDELLPGELAANLIDKKLFIGNDSKIAVELGGSEQGGVAFDAATDYKAGDVVTQGENVWVARKDLPAKAWVDPWDPTKPHSDEWKGVLFRDGTADFTELFSYELNDLSTGISANKFAIRKGGRPYFTAGMVDPVGTAPAVPNFRIHWADYAVDKSALYEFNFDGKIEIRTKKPLTPGTEKISTVLDTSDVSAANPLSTTNKLATMNDLPVLADAVTSTTAGTETRIAEMVQIKQADYDALATKQADKLYIIVG